MYKLMKNNRYKATFSFSEFDFLEIILILRGKCMEVLFRKSLIRHLPQQVSFLFRFSRKGSRLKAHEKFTRNKYQSMQIKTFSIGFLFTVKMVYQKLVKVRSYTRTRNGKKEKVRSYYRRYWGI